MDYNYFGEILITNLPSFLFGYISSILIYFTIHHVDILMRNIWLTMNRKKNLSDLFYTLYFIY